MDVAALKAEILGELVPQIRDVIGEALGPHRDLVVDPHTDRVLGLTKRTRKPMSAEDRKARGERMAAGRKAARER